MLARAAIRATRCIAPARGTARCIQTGERVPDVAMLLVREDGNPGDVSHAELFGGRKVVVVGIPGAFTPVCQTQHLPTFVDNADKIKAKGVDEIVCATVNDAFVCREFAKAIGAEGKITMLADWQGTFSEAVDQAIDLSAAALGVRSKRYAMVVDDGTVTFLATEDSPAEAKVTTAEAVLAAL